MWGDRNNRIPAFQTKARTDIEDYNRPFVLFVGTKKRVKRKKFEEFIRGRMII